MTYWEYQLQKQAGSLIWEVLMCHRKNHITFKDYNRDGYKDFSIWYLDKGMGTYQIYRLSYLFSC